MSRLALPVAALAVSAVVALGAHQAPPLTGLLDSYLAGRYGEAVTRAAAADDLGPLRLRFVQDVPAWVRADPAQTDKRRAAAAAFLLELTHARLESDWGRLNDLIEFTCVDLRAAGPPSPFELAWHRASIALAGRARARLWLLGEFPQLPHQPQRKVTVPQDSKTPPSPRHLMQALERFPDDPELQLARITAWLWGRDQEPIRNVRSRFGNDSPMLMIPRSRTQREALVPLQPLAASPVVGAEALVRTGFVHFSIGDYTAALGAFEAAARTEAPTAIRYLARYSAGRTLEALARPEEAIARYREALAVVPEAESAAVALASLQFVHDDRESAVTLMRDAFAQPARAVDPGRLAGYGSFMHWPELRAAMRQELAR